MKKENTILIKRDLKIKTPMIPNFILHDRPELGPIPIQDFSDKELHIIGRAFTRELIEKARNRR